MSVATIQGDAALKISSPQMSPRSFRDPESATAGVKAEDFNLFKLHQAAQIRDLSQSLEEATRAIELLRSHEEHTKTRVLRAVEEHGKRLDALEQLTEARDGTLARISKRMGESFQLPEVSEPDASHGPGRQAFRGLEERVELLEGITRATALMCNDSEARLREELEQQDAAWRAALEEQRVARGALEAQLADVSHGPQFADVQDATHKLHEELRAQSARQGQLEQELSKLASCCEAAASCGPRVESLEHQATACGEQQAELSLRLEREMAAWEELWMELNQTVQGQAHAKEELLAQLDERLGKEAPGLEALQERLTQGLERESSAREGLQKQLEQRLQKDREEALNRAGKVEARQAQLTRGLEEERRERTEAVERGRAAQEASEAKLGEQLREGLASEAAARGEGWTQREEVFRKESAKLEEALSRTGRRMAEENSARLEELIKKEAATRVDKLFNLSQRLEDVEQEILQGCKLQDVQQRLEKALEPWVQALDKEVAGRKSADAQLDERLSQLSTAFDSSEGAREELKASVLQGLKDLNAMKAEEPSWRAEMLEREATFRTEVQTDIVQRLEQEFQHICEVVDGKVEPCSEVRAWLVQWQEENSRRPREPVDEESVDPTDAQLRLAELRRAERQLQPGMQPQAALHALQVDARQWLRKHVLGAELGEPSGEAMVPLSRRFADAGWSMESTRWAAFCLEAGSLAGALLWARLCGRAQGQLPLRLSLGALGMGACAGVGVWARALRTQLEA